MDVCRYMEPLVCVLAIAPTTGNHAYQSYRDDGDQVACVILFI